MIKENSFFAKIKFYIFTLIFLLILGVVIGLLITVGLNNKQEETKLSNLENNNQIIDLTEKIDEPLTEVEENIDIPVVSSQEDTPLQIGVDLPAGIYKLISKQPTAFYRISTTYNADFIDIKDNDVFSSFTYIKVDDGDYLTLIDTDAISLENSPNHSIKGDSTHQNVKYLVGKDIQAGSYNVSPDVKYGFVEVSNSPIRSQSATVLSSYITKPLSINLLEGQYIKISQSKIMLNQ